VTTRRTRIVLIVTTALIAAVVVLFALALTSSRNTERDSAKQRFSDEAAVSSALISALFDSSSAQVAQAASKQFGATIDPKQLDAYAKKSRLSYAVILDAQGHPIAQSTRADDSVTAAISEGPTHIKQVIQGAPWRLSGITKGNVAEYASSFKGADGKLRVMVQGFPVQLVSGFVSGTLAKLPNAEKEKALVVDGTGHVISSAGADVAPGSPAPKIGKDRVETRAGIDNTEWTTVLSQKDADLFEGVGSSVQWLILLALAAAGVIAVMLLRRAIGQANQISLANTQLETANRDLARTNLELTRSNGELEQFASVASHDLQEPLRKVQTFGDQLERRFAVDLNEEARDYLQRMRSASARMSVLIDDLLRFSRVTTHAKPHIPVDLDRIARDVLQDLEARLQESKGSVVIEALPMVEADPTQMRQLLQNLIANALKFHREGAPPVVRVAPAESPQPGMVAFTVSDNGIGFESNYEERIFRVFERLHPRDVYAGTGIGLALCRKIVERHGGQISGEGRVDGPNPGATFTVVLPAAPSTNGRPSSSIPAQPPVHA
jgi:signal transduction histidine kinase